MESTFNLSSSTCGKATTGKVGTVGTAGKSAVEILPTST